MGNQETVLVRAAQPTPENPIRAKKQRQSIRRASQKFEETLADLKSVNRAARVEIDSASGWARTVRGTFRVGTPIPPAQQRQFRYMLGAREMGNHPAAAFLDRFSVLFGLDNPMEQLFLRGVTPLSQGDWFAFGIDIFAVGHGAPAQVDVVVAPNGAVIYAGFGQAGEVPGRN